MYHDLWLTSPPLRTRRRLHVQYMVPWRYTNTCRTSCQLQPPSFPRESNQVLEFQLIFDHLRPSYTGSESDDEVRRRRQTLGGAARTCKRFRDPALRSLWWELDGLRVVVVVIRVLTGVNGSVCSYHFFSDFTLTPLNLATRGHCSGTSYDVYYAGTKIEVHVACVKRWRSDIGGCA